MLTLIKIFLIISLQYTYVSAYYSNLRRSMTSIFCFKISPLYLKRSKTDLKLDDNQEYEDEFNETVGKSEPVKHRKFDTSNKVNRKSIFQGLAKFENINRALLAGLFVAGIGAGITIDSAINTNPKDLASRDAIDRNAPNPKLCATFGSSAMVLDQRVFVTFNPFNVYVTQADAKPGCVIRPSNVVQLLQNERKLLSNEEVEGCKNGFNTWAYVGDINSKPQLTCVFQSDDAQNEFLSNPKVGLGEDIYDKYNSDAKNPNTISQNENQNGKLVKKKQEKLN